MNYELWKDNQQSYLLVYLGIIRAQICTIGASYQSSKKEKLLRSVSLRLIISLKNMASKALKKQHGGNHYLKHKIQPWHIIDEYNLNYYEGNILKYLLRDKNNRKEDLQKLIHYAEYCIERLDK